MIRALRAHTNNSVHNVVPCLLGILLLAFTCSGSALAGDISDTERDASAQQQKLDALKARVAKLQNKLDSEQDRYSKLRNQLRKSEKSIGRINRKIKNIDRKLTKQQARMRDLQAERKQLRDDLDGQRDVLAGAIRASYAIGRQEYLKLLLNQQDPAVLGRTVVLYDYLNKARTEKIATIDQKVRDLKQVEVKINEQTQQLEATRKRRLEQKQQLEDRLEKRSTVLTALNKQITSRKQKLAQAKTDVRQLEDLMQGLRRALADVPANAGVRKSFKSQKGKLRLPVKGRVSARYGSRRGSTGLRWQGVVIRAKRGREVKSISHGRVAFADWLRGFGLMVIVDHGNGYMSLYGHNDSLYVETGDWIETGETIAAVGTSGGRKTPALYFEIRHNGKPTNPLRWCRR